MTAIASVPTVTVKRTIAASPQELFDAWLNPGALAEWMRPASGSTGRSTVEVDARVGGAFEIVMHVASGPVRHSGVYQTIDAPHRLVFTWNSPHTGPDDTLVTVDFLAAGAATDIVITHERLPETARNGHTAGWTAILETLAQVFGA